MTKTLSDKNLVRRSPGASFVSALLDINAFKFEQFVTVSNLKNCTEAPFVKCVYIIIYIIMCVCVLRMKVMVNV